MCPSRRFLLTLALLPCAALVGCAGVALAPNAEERQALAPTGSLRVGVYPGSPTSMVTDRTTGEAKGVTYDLGKSLAARLGVKFEPVEMATLAEVLAAVKAGTIDFTGTNASPARAAEMDFTATMIEIELGYLVLASSPALTVQDIDRRGTRVGVTRGSTSQTTLPRILKDASVIPVPTLKIAGQMLSARDIDVFATNKVLLFELADGIQGSRILDGRWGVEQWAFAIPKGREKGLRYVRQFADEAQTDGLLKRAVERAGLRGTVRPAP